jgi:hypothetical protein
MKKLLLATFLISLLALTGCGDEEVEVKIPVVEYEEVVETGPTESANEFHETERFDFPEWEGGKNMVFNLTAKNVDVNTSLSCLEGYLSGDFELAFSENGGEVQTVSLGNLDVPSENALHLLPGRESTFGTLVGVYLAVESYQGCNNNKFEFYHVTTGGKLLPVQFTDKPDNLQFAHSIDDIMLGGWPESGDVAEGVEYYEQMLMMEVSAYDNSVGETLVKTYVRRSFNDATMELAE